MRLAKARTPAGPHGRRSRWRAFGIGFVALSVAIPTVIGGQLEAANAASGQIRGHVFIDYDNDGVFDSGNTPQSGVANDKELAGVTVNAYNAANTLVGTATTAATGNPNYTLTLSGVTDGDPLRLEFIPPTGNYDSFYGTNSTTSVRFVQAGAENVDFGITRPDFYNSNDPYVATVLQRSGLPSASYNTNTAAVVLNRWSVATNASSPFGNVNDCNPTCSWTDRKTVAKIPDVGSVYSVAYDPVGRDLYVAATYKRGAGLGALGIGGIYRINDVLDSAGNLTPGIPTITNWTSVANAPLNINVGTAQTNNDRGLNASDGYFADLDGFQKATKIGIGGMVIDPDSRILYFINLYDTKLYAISLGTTPSLIGSWSTPATSTGVAPTFTQRAFALTLRDGMLYVGYNDTGEAYPFCPASSPGSTYTGNNRTGSCSGSGSSPMTAYVAKAQIDTAGAPGAWTTVLTAPLNYRKGNQIYDWQGDGSDYADDNPQVLRWNTWTDWWTGAGNPAPNPRTVAIETLGNWLTDNNGNPIPYWIHIYPQPFVASITLDANGFMTLGLGDRTSTQSGNRQAAANDLTPSNPTFESIADGDTLIAGLNTNGTYTLETNGTVTGSTSGSRVATPGRQYQPAGAEGPGGIEFYFDHQDLGGDSNHITHREASLGATATAQGVDQVLTTMIDPLAPIRVGGLAWFNSFNGDLTRGYQHEIDEDDGSRKQGFQKGGGIGAVTLLLKDAPVEIGNRVWYDADMDGIQDADEAAINDAPVQLWTADVNGNPVTQLASTTTSTVNGQAGTWYFRSESATGGVTGFNKNGNYVVVFPSGTGAVNLVWPAGMSTPPGFTGLTWAQMQRTAASASGSTALNDSNPNPTNGRAPVTIGGGSESNHTIDAGWFGMSTFRIEKAIVGTPPPGKTYTFNITAATNFRGDNRLGSGGPDTPPIVDTISYTLNPGQTITSTEQIPYGYKLTFEEAGVSGPSVAFSPPLGGDDDHGFLVITPTLTPGGVKVTATNSYGSVDLTKILADGASLPPGTKFPIEYQIGSDPVVTTDIEAGVANTLHIVGIPLGTTVKVRETLSTPATLGGYVWVAPTWDQAGSPLTPDLDGWVTVTVTAATPPIELNLTNHPMDVPVLPLAGGIGEYIFTIVGGIVIIFGAGLGVWHFFLASRRRRRPAAHRA